MAQCENNKSGLIKKKKQNYNKVKNTNNCSVTIIYKLFKIIVCIEIKMRYRNALRFK